MKKILTMLLFATAFMGCNTEDDPQINNSTNFGGKLKVTSVATPTAAPFELSDVHFELVEASDGTFNLTMHEIRFASSMPMSLTIVIPQLKLTRSDGNGDGYYELSSIVDPIIPYIGDKPYAMFEIPEFTGKCVGGRLEVSFVCRNSKIPVGGESLNHRAVFQGTLLK